MKFLGSLLGISSPKKMGKEYMKVGRNALFGQRTSQRDGLCTDKVPRPLSFLVSKNGKLKHGLAPDAVERIEMEIDEGVSLSFVRAALDAIPGRLSAIFIGILTLVIGIILSSIPWVDYIILKQLRLWNGSLSFQYWQKPGVVRLTKVYIFNVTNAENFLQYNEKPKLQEIGPFVYKEDMEKVNIVFHNNGTVSYQHKKILNFVPEMSKDKNLKVIVPNIPLLTLSTQSKGLPRIINLGLHMFLGGMHMTPFVPVTAQQLVFGYDDPLVSIAHQFFPKARRPMSQMGLLLGRNGTLEEVSTIFTGHTDMKEFGLINRLNGLDRLPYWPNSPCNSIRASEGSFFPPRDKTGSDIVHIWDKDLCRVLPLRYRGPVKKSGIKADLYTPPDSVFGRPNETSPENECFCSDDMSTCPFNGLQNISPCQYSAPVYLSFPHFYKADPKLLDAVHGLKPNRDIHETYFKIQPKLGVPLEGKVRVQLNLKVEHQPYIGVVSNFPDIVFPIMWVEEGIEELTPSIRRWIYLATTFSDVAAPCTSYGLILVGITIVFAVFVKAYNNVMFTHEAIELGKRTIRRGSTLLVNGQHKLLITREQYVLLSNDNDEKSARIE